MKTLPTPEVRSESRRGQLVSNRPAHTLYLDRPLPRSAAVRTLPRHLAGVLPLADPAAERADAAALLGLGALIVPAVLYSFAQLSTLVSGGALSHAIHALLP